MRLAKQKQQRILLLFCLWIVLPCLLLGYLAFRGIQNDQALIEKKMINEHRKIAEKISRSIEKTLSSFEQGFFKAIPVNNYKHHPGIISLLNRLKKNQPLVKEVFFQGESNKIVFPAAQLLFLPDDNSQHSQELVRNTSMSGKIRRAHQLEFKYKRYRKAISIYQEALKQVLDPQIKGELMNAIARLQKKSFMFKDAINTFKTIVRDYNSVRLANGIPLGPGACLELSHIYRTIKKSTDALETLTQLYKNLLDRKWILNRAQFDFFSQSTKTSIKDILSEKSSPSRPESYLNMYQLLVAKEKKHRENTEKLMLFQENAMPSLLAKESSVVNQSVRAIHRLTIKINETNYLVSVLNPFPVIKDIKKEYCGLIFDVDYLKNNILLKIFQNQVLPKMTEWLVRRRDGKILLNSKNAPTESLTIKTYFAGNFPDWSIEFYQSNPHLLETFLTSRHGFYFYMFLLIGGILIFGLILTIRTVAHELELAKMKSDFVSTVSHEFKSPLTSIRQMAEMLQTGRVPSEQHRQKYYDILLEQVERLSLLTENVLDFARLEEGKREFVFEEINFSQLLKEIIPAFQDKVWHEGFDIQLEIKQPLPPVTADRTAISQVITNLLDNAVKYSGQSRKIVVQSLLDGQYLVVSVKDFGIGIHKKDIQRIFDRFFRGGDELSRTIKGSGLGLTLVRKYMQAHGGTVQVDSEPGKGSKF